jgi:peroxiredoxin/outer membrane lipoprotein-sorting protein
MRHNIITLGMALCLPMGLAAMPAPAQNASSPAVSKPASRLTTARTITATATFSVSGPKGELKPFFGVTITVESPRRYRIDAVPLANQAKAPSFFFCDGVKQYEYNSLQGKYTIQAAPKAGERAKTQLYTMAGMGLILTPDAPPSVRITRTTGEEMLDGRRMQVTTDLEPPRTSAGQGSFASGTRTWCDAETGLPVRQCEIVVREGVATTNLQLDFAGWKFDAPIPRQTFVWKVPEGAVEASDALLRIGTPAPDFTAGRADGATVHLSDLKGKIVILDFWATWCGPCQRSMPHLEKVYQQVKDKGVEVLGLCVWDERKEYDKWVAAKKGVYNFPLAFDPAGRAEGNIAKKLFLVTGIPTQYVIDKDGKVAASFVGYEEGSHQLEDALRKLHVDIAAPTSGSDTKKEGALR